MATNKSIAETIMSDLDAIHASWGWFVALGIGLIVLGVICILGAVTATVATVLAVGWLLLIGALLSLIQAFTVRNWRGFLIYLLNALLSGFTGYLLIRYPAAGAMSVTLVLASFFVVGGIFRAVAASALQFPSWGWTAASGVVSLVLGTALLIQLPLTSIWFIGLAVGVEFIFDGFGLTMLGSAVRKVPSSRSFANA
jgi:uncharacterized membrane protein HdeD (DUF308 family)